MKASTMDLSIIIPCYNEKKVIRRNTAEIMHVLDNTRCEYEIIFVDDKSSDNTRDLIISLAKQHPNIRYIFHIQNEGRGKSVEDGMRIASGKASGFIDLDLATPAHYIPVMYDKIVEGYDIASADRYYRLSVDSISIFHRYLLHKAYRLLVRLLLKPKLKDTETGCKFFNTKKILPLLDEIEDQHWFWDTEIIVRASYKKDLRLIEIPTIYIRKQGTTVKVIRDSFNYAIKLLRFWWKKDYLKR